MYSIKRTIGMEEIQNNQSAGSAMLPGVLRAQSATGDLRIHQFDSRIFRNRRFLRVWLPPGYDKPENAARRYPVLYLNDGQNLFEPATSFNGVEWQADETGDRLIREGIIPPIILVGIDNAGKERFREYMPHRSLQPMMLRVNGSRYPSFLAKEVMPFVQRHYRVASGPQNTGLGGSSLGALISLYTVSVSPGVIGRLLLESPSLWASNRQIIRQSRRVRRWPERVFLATGTAEAGRPDRDQSMVDDVRELAAMMGRGGLDDRRLRLVIEEGATHHESAWARRFPQALSFLFGEGR
ncbi:MAG TPA: alpha/beta hydrolase-fold protein [Candidatus Sulfotelmatobacter sp.]|nr:alpha/beta hydrolase-fold protein [Candidatus Sulfotelmatobacter sp.]